MVLTMSNYTIRTTINDEPIGEFARSIPDPFVHHTVTVGWRDLLRAVLRGKPMRVEIHVSADSDTMTRVLELDPDYIGPTGSASRTAWNADLQGRLAEFGSSSDTERTP
jgi:hypothetical protein